MMRQFIPIIPYTERVHFSHRDGWGIVFSHRGFYGTINTTRRRADGFYGHLLDVKALVSYEGDTLKQLSVAFEEAVEHFIANKAPIDT